MAMKIDKTASDTQQEAPMQGQTNRLYKRQADGLEECPFFLFAG